MQRNGELDKWSSSQVPRGGIFNISKVKYSKGTQEFIKLLMEEQKMNMMQRNKINSYLGSGEPLPVAKPQRTIKTECRPGIDFMNVRSAKRRTLNAIKASGDLEPEKYIPKRYEPWEEKKIRLQDEMAGLKHFSPERTCKMQKKKSEGTKEKPVNLTDELLQEIQERLEWIEEMTKLGEGHKYKQIIQNEIAERLRLVKKYDAESNQTN